jgi:hypothetical protein
LCSCALQVVGWVVKALKLQAKHDAPAAALMRAGNGEVRRLVTVDKGLQVSGYKLQVSG